MADYTWPFAPGREFSPQGFDESVQFNVEVNVARSGRVTTQSLPGGRWRAVLRFGDMPISFLKSRRQLEAFLLQQRGGADRLLLWNLLTPEPLGTMRGTVTLAATVAGGASTAQLAGGVSAPNILRGGSFESDANADGVADAWASYSAGAVTGAAFSLSATLVGGFGSLNQAMSATSLGTSTSDRLGVSQVGVPVVAGLAYSLSAYAAWTAASTAALALYVDWRTAGGAFISSTAYFGVNLSGSLSTRYTTTATAPALAALADVYIFAHSRSGAAGVAAFAIDGAQFEQAAAPTSFAGLPTLLRGDRLAFGGQRVVLTADATATDAGGVTIAFQPAHRAGASSGSSVTLVKPTTKYVVAQPVVQMPVSGAMLPGFAVELVEE